jgi:hypothetical protein
MPDIRTQTLPGFTTFAFSMITCARIAGGSTRTSRPARSSGSHGTYRGAGWVPELMLLQGHDQVVQACALLCDRERWCARDCCCVHYKIVVHACMRDCCMRYRIVRDASNRQIPQKNGSKIWRGVLFKKRLKVGCIRAHDYDTDSIMFPTYSVENTNNLNPKP